MEVEGQKSKPTSRFLGFLKWIYHLLPPPPTTNYLYRHFDINPYQLLPDNPVIFDIGSKGGRASYAFGTPPSDAKVVCVDVEARSGVDLIADAHNLDMVESATVDCVVTISALEHMKYPRKVVDEIHRILKPGGVLYVSVPFIFPFHSDPDDFYRFSNHGIEVLCEDFKRLDSGFNRGPASTMHHLLVHFLAIVFSFNSSALYGLNVDLFRWLLFWLKYLDRFIASYRMAYIIHSGVYFIGQKPK